MREEDTVPQRSSYTEGTPNWVDLQTPDVGAAKAFYASVFGWSYDDQPMPQGGAYSMALVAGDPVAAIAPQSPDMAAAGTPPAWNTYIATDDVDAAVARVAGAGGTVAMEPFDVVDAGRMAFVLDPSGAPVALWQARNHIGARRVNEPNTLTWNELMSNDLDAALPFYEAVLGVTARATPMGDDEYTMLYVGENETGGAAPPMEGAPNHWHVWFAVSDADAAAAAARDGGGRVIIEPTDMPVGRMATLADPQGAVFSVIATNQAPE
jgi:predicted enzyme related to lactoylglutathione lyase